MLWWEEVSVVVFFFFFLGFFGGFTKNVCLCACVCVFFFHSLQICFPPRAMKESERKQQKNAYSTKKVDFFYRMEQKKNPKNIFQFRYFFP